MFSDCKLSISGLPLKAFLSAAKMLVCERKFKGKYVTRVHNSVDRPLYQAIFLMVADEPSDTVAVIFYFGKFFHLNLHLDLLTNHFS